LISVLLVMVTFLKYAYPLFIIPAAASNEVVLFLIIVLVILPEDWHSKNQPQYMLLNSG